MPNAIALLKNDHTTVRTLLGQLDSAVAPRDRQRLANRIADALEEHSAIEEEIFYPAYRAAAGSWDDDEVYFKSREEHELVGQAVDDLCRTDPRSASFGGRARVVRQLVEAHATEEERSMFPRAEQLMGEQRLNELGDEIERRKRSAPDEQPQTGRPRQARPPQQPQQPRPRQQAGGSSSRCGYRFAIPFCGSVTLRW